MAASYCILMVRGEAEIGNSFDAQRWKQLDKPATQYPNSKHKWRFPSGERADHAWESFSRNRPVRVV